MLLTAIVTAHAEERLLRPTLRSVLESLEVLSNEHGQQVELIIVLDNASSSTVAEAERWSGRTTERMLIRTVTSSVGESGLARNIGISNSAGEHIALVDGDDLVSANYFSNALKVLAKKPGDVVIHPELVLSFGARSVYWKVRGADHPEVSYLDLVEHNLWPSSLVTRRTTALKHPYTSLHPSSGFGPEDWYWNIQTTLSGVQHLVAPDTVFMYRVRARGGVNNRHAHSILPWFDFFELQKQFPLRYPAADTTEQKKPNRFTPRNLVRGLYRRARPVLRACVFWLSEKIRARLRNIAGSIYRGVFRIQLVDVGIQSRRTTSLTEHLLALADLEPAISWTVAQLDELPEWTAAASGYTDCLETALVGLAGRSAWVAVPWVGIGGADMVSLNYAKALANSEKYQNKTAFLSTHLPERTVHELIPGTIRYQQMPQPWRSLPGGQQRRLLAQLLILSQPEIVISVNCFDLVQTLGEYADQIAASSRVYLTLFAWDKIAEGYPTTPITDDSQREFLDSIDAIITDNSNTAELVMARTGLDAGQVLVHHQPAQDHTPELPRGTRAYNNEFFSEKNPFKIVWPHRLDKEKRPDVLPELIEELRRRQLHVELDIWGQRVLSDEDDLLATLSAASINYRGPYQGGLPGLDTYQYHALLLTSESEGLPLVLVQALFAGLPVVASAVGGVPEIIRHGVTGLTAPGPEAIQEFADAIEQLYRSVALRRELIENGYSLAVSQHSSESFVATVNRDIIRV